MFFQSYNVKCTATFFSVHSVNTEKCGYRKAGLTTIRLISWRPKILLTNSNCTVGLTVITVDWILALARWRKGAVISRRSQLVHQEKLRPVGKFPHHENQCLELPSIRWHYLGPTYCIVLYCIVFHLKSVNTHAHIHIMQSSTTLQQETIHCPRKERALTAALIKHLSLPINALKNETVRLYLKI